MASKVQQCIRNFGDRLKRYLYEGPLTLYWTGVFSNRRPELLTKSRKQKGRKNNLERQKLEKNISDNQNRNFRRKLFQ
jgi:hypothetical protein